MTNPADLSAVELIAAYRSRKLSPVEALEAVLKRVEASEPQLKALWAYDPQSARAAAKASEARWSKGEPAGPIDGIPTTLKENIPTKGLPTPLGCAAVPLIPAAEDAPPAARTRESGAVIFAKTTMPDLGMLSSGLSSFHELARNPWDLRLNPGGSSAGAAAAAAAGYGPLHVGTDLGGSIRLPAGWCGLVGLKPSFGRIPVDSPFIGRVAGPMTRTVADAALYMSVLARPDSRDSLSLPFADLPWTDLEGLNPKTLRIGLWMEPGFGLPLDPEVRAAVAAAARLFADAGAQVEPLGPFLTRPMIDGLDKFWRSRSWAAVKRLPEEGRAKILPYIMAWVETAQDLSGEEVYAGFEQTEAIREAALKATEAFDFVISPTAPNLPYAAASASPIDDPQKPFEHIAYTVAFNLSAQPSLSLNCGYAENGLPIGLQITGRRLDDLGVLRLARLFEELRPTQKPWPVLA
ncbi:amidase [Neomegalonema perideroedes]|uniref:amidase n=1 Tax=Neomegalonema perideroedes TaxID=217219 RepID=UPI00037B3C32|nr:amidase [Neomegalonema perideroedes]